MPSLRLWCSGEMVQQRRACGELGSGPVHAHARSSPQSKELLAFLCFPKGAREINSPSGRSNQGLGGVPLCFEEALAQPSLLCVRTTFPFLPSLPSSTSSVCGFSLSPRSPSSSPTWFDEPPFSLFFFPSSPWPFSPSRTSPLMAVIASSMKDAAQLPSWPNVRLAASPLPLVKGRAL